MANQLGGLFAWEIDSDNGDILNAMHEGLGHGEGTTPPANKAPIANAGSAQSITGPSDIVLDGGLSRDPEGQALTYAWTQTSGPAITLVNADFPQARFSLQPMPTLFMFSHSRSQTLKDYRQRRRLQSPTWRLRLIEHQRSHWMPRYRLTQISR